MAYAPVIANAAPGRDARYSLAGLQQVSPGVYTDGYYKYDSSGRGINRPNPAAVAGLPLANASESYNVMTGQHSLGALSGGGGGGGGGGFAPSGAYGLDVAQAKLAYDRAVAAADTGIQNLNKGVGVLNQNGKFSIDPYNEYGTLRMLLGNIGGSMNDAWAAAADRHIGHRGLGAQGETDARRIGSAQVADLGNQYSQQYQQFLTNKSDALAAYNLAKQMAEYYANLQGSYWGGGGGGGGDVGVDTGGDTGGFILDSRGNIDNTGLDFNSARAEHLSLKNNLVKSVAAAKKPAPKPAPKKKLPMGAIRTG